MGITCVSEFPCASGRIDELIAIFHEILPLAREKNGCEKIINLDLNDQEMMKFSESAEAVRRMNLALKEN